MFANRVKRSARCLNQPQIVKTLSEAALAAASTSNGVKGSTGALTNGANRTRLHRSTERSRGSEMLRESERQCRRGPS
jgi:hypothetical protein